MHLASFIIRSTYLYLPVLSGLLHLPILSSVPDFLALRKLDVSLGHQGGPILRRGLCEKDKEMLKRGLRRKKKYK